MKLWQVAVAVAFVLSCDGTPEPKGLVAGSLDGFVYVTGPVEGAVVTAYVFGEDGQPHEVAHSEPSKQDGSFHLDLHAAWGPMLLVARGVGATYTEPATKTQVKWDVDTQIRGAWAGRPNGKDITVSFPRGSQGQGFVLTPWSDLAVAYADARVRKGMSQTFEEALARAHVLFADHLEVDFWAVPPADLTSGMHLWDAQAHAGVLLAGVSALVDLANSQSHTHGMTSIQLFATMRRDAGDGLFDGRDGDTPLTFGTCMDLCALHGGETLRGELASNMSSFLQDQNKNASGIAEGIVHDLEMRIAVRQSELFPAGQQEWDSIPPTITVVESEFFDEDTMIAMVLDSPDPWGTAAYSYFSAVPTAVSLNGSSTATFSKYATRYQPDSTNLPIWRFLAQDDRTADADLVVEARVLRQQGSTFAVLGDWQAVPMVMGQGYNRAVTLSSALHPEVALVGGTYRLEVRASDKASHQVTQTVSWTQTILPPPVRQRPGPGCDPCGDLQCPGHYSLDIASGCLPGWNGYMAVGGSGVPDGHLYLASVVVDNPNSVPVRVKFDVSANAHFSQRTAIQSNVIGPMPTNQRCNDRYQLLDGTCVPYPSGGSVTGVDVGNVFGTLEIRLPNGALLDRCPACDPNERELPPTSSLLVRMYSAPYQFVFPGPIYDIVSNRRSLGTPSGPVWFQFSGVFTDILVSCGTGGSVAACPSGNLSFEQTFRYLDAVSVQAPLSSSLEGRPAHDLATLVPARGTNTGGFSLGNLSWRTHSYGSVDVP